MSCSQLKIRNQQKKVNRNLEIATQQKTEETRQIRQDQTKQTKQQDRQSKGINKRTNHKKQHKKQKTIQKITQKKQPLNSQTTPQKQQSPKLN